MSAVIAMNGGFFVHKDLDLDMPIFRCVQFRYILDLLKNKKMFFHNVTCWEDTWEDPSRFFEVSDVGYGEIGPSFIMQYAPLVVTDLFGTCWTNNIASDALWRIYSGPEKSGICIQTTVRKLFNSIDFSFCSGGFIDGFIGPVRYENLTSAEDGYTFFDNISESYPNNMISSFIKRHAFEHEHEIRFLIHAANHTKFYPHNPLQITINKEEMFLPLKNLEFIDWLILDPRLTQEEVTTYQTELTFCKRPIRKSTLYDIPDEKLQLILQSKSMSHNQLLGAKRWNGFDFFVR